MNLLIIDLYMYNYAYISLIIDSYISIYACIMYDLCGSVKMSWFLLFFLTEDDKLY